MTWVGVVTVWIVRTFGKFFPKLMLNRNIQAPRETPLAWCVNCTFTDLLRVKNSF
jgi:hypothetical protein